MHRRYAAVSILLTAASLLAADAANVSGTWLLNVKRSRWADKMTPPNGVTLDIQHSEPALKYTGTVNLPNESAPKKFAFDGAIDGKEYTATEDGVERRVAFKRISDRSVESNSTLPGGGKEHAVITISRDGRSMERRLRVTNAERTVEWTEIYEKKQ
jgi:hypothetical protein